MRTKWQSMTTWIVAAGLVATFAMTARASDQDIATRFGVDANTRSPWVQGTSEHFLYERARYGSESRLILDDGQGHWRVYRATGYPELLQAHPELAEITGLEETAGQVDAEASARVVDPDAVTSVATTFVKVPRLTYAVRSASPVARLYVDWGGQEYVYPGKDLEEILTRTPKLADLEGIATLRKEVEDLDPVRFATDAPAPAGDEQPSADRAPTATPQTMPVAVELWREPTHVTLRTWRLEDGIWKAGGVSGDDLVAVQTALQADDPALARRLVLPMPSATIAGARLVLRPCFEGESMRLCVTVASVASDGESARLGLQPGDVILSVNGQEVADLEACAEAWKRTADGGTSLVVQRGNERVTLTQS